MAHQVPINAKAHKISAVTVYQTNRAVVQRTFHVVLKRGQNDVIIKGLPTTVQGDSLRVEILTKNATHGLTVMEVLHIPPSGPSRGRKGPDKTENPELISFREQQADLEYRLGIISTSTRALSEYAKKFGVEASPTVPITATPAELEFFLKTFEPRQLELNGRYNALQKSLDELKKKIKSIEELIKENQSIDQDFTGVKVTVLAEEKGNAELNLTYATPGASWSSFYDLRVTTVADPMTPPAKSSEQPKRFVQVAYQADISQSTGEDWDGVVLTLSTASYQRPQDIPEVEPWRIGTQRSITPPHIVHHTFPATITMVTTHSPDRRRHQQALGDDDESYTSRHRRARRRSRSPTSFRARSPSRSRSPSPRLRSFAARINQVDVREGLISTSFDINGLASIPSDDSSHKVAIAMLILPAQFEWVSAPRKTAAAFLRCLIENDSSYYFLPGPSNLFMDGNFMSKSTIPEVSSGERFSISLGVDPSIKVTYHPQKKTVSTSGGGPLGLMSSSRVQVTEIRQRITIKITRKTGNGIEKLIVSDRIPVSEDSRIKVVLIEPSEKLLGPLNSPAMAGSAPSSPISPPVPPKTKSGSGFGSLLKSSGDHSTTALSRTSSMTAASKVERNLNVRWAQKNEDSDPSGTGGSRGDGVVEWIGSNIKDGLELGLAYQIVAPVGLSWHNL